MTHRVPSAYADTSIVFGIASQDLGAEQDAATCILDAHESGTLRLVRSHVTKEEIAKATDTTVDDALYSRLAGIPAVDEEPLVPHRVIAWSGVRPPTVEIAAEFAALRKILRDENDARHLFQAVGN